MLIWPLSKGLWRQYKHSSLLNDVWRRFFCEKGVLMNMKMKTSLRIHYWILFCLLSAGVFGAEPFAATFAPPDVTNCLPGGPGTTTCPEVVTICTGPVDTICTAPIDTECPIRLTICPDTKTECPRNPEETKCPRKKTKCPVIKTKCQCTKCPKVETECPVVKTECPEVKVETECPKKRTECPECKKKTPANDGFLSCPGRGF